MTLLYCVKCRRGFMGGRALMTHMDERHPPLEKHVQRDVMDLYTKVGCTVYNLSQGYRPEKCRHCGKALGRAKNHATTRQTPGLADLYVVPPPRRVQMVPALGTTPTFAKEAEFYAPPFWHETKRPRLGVQSDPQRQFQSLCEARAVGYVLGGVPEARVHLVKIGLVRG